MRYSLKAFLICLLLPFVGFHPIDLAAEGIPEPSLVLYGVITDASTQARITTGEIQWALAPSNGGDSVIVSGQLENLIDQYSYLLIIPCESPLGVEPATPNTLQLSSTPVVYDLSQVLVNGKEMTFSNQNLQSLELSEADRGTIQRIDLLTEGSTIDTDGNGLPDDWEMAHFSQLGVDPQADPDGDGLSNYAEWKAGTDPNEFGSQFTISTIESDSQGGVSIHWNSIEGRTYSVWRSADLLGEFQLIASGVGATPPLNVYLDSTAVGKGPYFYQLEVEE